MMEEEGFAELVLNHEEAIKDGLVPFIREQDPEAINQILDLFLQRARLDTNPELIRQLFKTLTKNFNITEVEPKKLDEFFYLTTQRVRNVDEAKPYKDLLYTLLDKINITKAEGDIVNGVLQRVLQRAGTEQDVRLVENLFYTLSSKARPKWVRQTLAPYIKEKKRVVKSPILPKNCIMYQEELDGTEVFVIEVDKQQFDVTYHKTPFHQVGHPKLLFEFHVRTNRVYKCRIFAVKDAITKPSSKLYHYPFSNVFPTFNACWPDLQSIVMDGVHQLSTLPYLFINSPSNDHLFRGSNLRELFAALQNKEFDDDLLEVTNLVVQDHFEME